MSSDADRDGDPLQRPPTGAIRCSLCGRGILRIKEIAKAAMKAGKAKYFRGDEMPGVAVVPVTRASAGGGQP